MSWTPSFIPSLEIAGLGKKEKILLFMMLVVNALDVGLVWVYKLL